jgi:hypothetical protein
LEQTKGQIKADQALPVLLAKTSIIVGQNNRKQMVEMLAEHGGTQQINEMPTIPEWATRGFFKYFNNGSSRPLRKCATY